jgi:hypothetical protein
VDRVASANSNGLQHTTCTPLWLSGTFKPLAAVTSSAYAVEGVVYVVDSGVVKQKHYHASTGMESLDVVPISRVHATQRAGRAGRTRAGKVNAST